MAEKFKLATFAITFAIIMIISVYFDKFLIMHILVYYFYLLLLLFFGGGGGYLRILMVENNFVPFNDHFITNFARLTLPECQQRESIFIVSELETCFIS